MFAIGGKADITRCAAMSAFDPKRTSTIIVVVVPLGNTSGAPRNYNRARNYKVAHPASSLLASSNHPKKSVPERKFHHAAKSLERSAFQNLPVLGLL